MKHLSFFFLMLTSLFLQNSAYSQEKYIASIDIIRHGDRTPIHDLPHSQQLWTEGLGQLTATGMSQEYRLGQKMRDRYVNQYHLLPEYYAGQSIYVRSTSFDRTLMSAHSFLLGLYPPGTGPYKKHSQNPALPHKIQPIPIYSYPKESDNIIHHYQDEALLVKLLGQYVYSTPEWQGKEEEFKQHYTAWSEATGVSLKDPRQLTHLADTLYIYQLYHRPIPNQLSQDDMKTIIRSGHWVMTTIFKNPVISSVAGSEFLKMIVDNLKKAQNHTDNIKYILYSAHDTTLLTQMSILDAPLHVVPKYASYMNFTLIDKGANDYVVRVTYNDDPVYIPFCGSYDCTIEQLEALANAKEVLAKYAIDSVQ